MQGLHLWSATLGVVCLFVSTAPFKQTKEQLVIHDRFRNITIVEENGPTEAVYLYESGCNYVYM